MHMHGFNAEHVSQAHSAYHYPAAMASSMDLSKNPSCQLQIIMAAQGDIVSGMNALQLQVGW
jgi:hypothetical protein